MSIDSETVKRVAEIARLNLTEEEVSRFSKDLSTILEAFRIMQKTNTEGVKPSFHPIDVKNAVREDKIEESLSQSDALSNVEKNKENGYFKGPRVV